VRAEIIALMTFTCLLHPPTPLWGCKGCAFTGGRGKTSTGYSSIWHDVLQSSVGARAHIQGLSALRCFCRCSWKTSFGVRYPRHFLGLLLMWFTIWSSWCCVRSLKCVPLGRCLRIRPLTCSLLP